MANIKPAQATLNALNGGQTMNQLAQAIHEATCSVRDTNKAAEVTITLKIRPIKDVSAGLAEAPIFIEAAVETKLPKPELPKTIFYIDSDGNPTQNAPERQTGLNLTVAQPGAATHGSE